MNGHVRRGNGETVAVLTAVVVLVLLRRLVMSDPAVFSWALPASWFVEPLRGLTRSALNVASCWVLLVLVPVVAGRMLGRARPLPWGALARVPPIAGGMRLPGGRRLVLLTAVLAAGAALVGILGTRFVPGVSAVYPVFRHAGDSAGSLVLSELLTVGLVLATELFYRGGALFALERRFGWVAVWLLVPIYALDHIGGAGAEILGSVATGALLGYLALMARSIWPGVIVHAACAVAADLTALELPGGG